MTEEEKRALLEGARGEVIERALSEAQHDREAAMTRCERCDKLRATQADYDTIAEGEGEHLCWAEWGSSCMLHDWRLEALSLRIRAEAVMRERDEARAQVKAWQDEELSRRRERDEARAVVAARWALAREVEELLGIAAGPAGDDRLREGVEAVRRLRSERDEARAQLAAVREAVREVLDEPHAYVGGRERALLDAALSDTAAAAKAYTRRVRAEALRLAADRFSAQPVTAGLLREWADEIERGER